jgi:deazaflavin-dependent oxidoreductase (nitroreductase family)
LSRPAQRRQQFLYLTTTGRRTGTPHRIEIWYVQHNSRFYLVSQYGEGSDWVQNIKNDPKVTFEVRGSTFHGIGRLVKSKKEHALSREVSKLMEEKYHWSEGLLVEIKPEPGSLTD